MTNKLALIFPGQGSQSVGMLASLNARFSSVRETFDTVSDIMGFDVWACVQEGPESRLNETEVTQIVMLAADVAIFNILLKSGIETPAYLAGHSLGEYPALVAAKAISLKEVTKVVAGRAKLMQSAVPLGVGAMAAIVGLTDDVVDDLCQQVNSADSMVMPANYNAIGQVVVAGHTGAVEQVIALAETEGARLAKIIPVSVPCHCPLLADAAEAFADVLANAPFKTPELPVISSTELKPYNAPNDIRRILQAQLVRPVQWVKTIQYLQANEVSQLVECGPGRVLQGLTKRIAPSLPVLNTHDDTAIHQTLSTLIGASV